MQEKIETGKQQEHEEERSIPFPKVRKIIEGANLLEAQKRHLIDAIENLFEPNEPDQELDLDEITELEFLEDIEGSLGDAISNIESHAGISDAHKLVDEVFRRQFGISLNDLTPIERSRLSDILDEIDVSVDTKEMDDVLESVKDRVKKLKKEQGIVMLDPNRDRTDLK